MRRCPVKIQSAIMDIQIPKDAQARKLGICFITSTELVRKKKQTNKQANMFSLDGIKKYVCKHLCLSEFSVLGPSAWLSR